jgi:hypothetical protein
MGISKFINGDSESVLWIKIEIMAHVGERAIGSNNVKVECPHCGFIQIEKIWIFKSDIYENSSNSHLFSCVNCELFYIRLSNGMCQKII